MATQISRVGQAIDAALANNDLSNAEAQTIIDAWNATRPGFSLDRDFAQSADELLALQKLIQAPMRPFTIASPAAQRILACSIDRRCR